MLQVRASFPAHLQFAGSEAGPMHTPPYFIALYLIEPERPQPGLAT